MVFDYIAKSGQERYVALADDLVRAAVRDLLRRRGGGPELLAYQDGDGSWHDVTSADINAYVKEHGRRRGVGQGLPHLARHGDRGRRRWPQANEQARTPDAPASARGRRRMKQVSGYLGNTPAVARKSYVDPRLVDLFNDGVDHLPGAGRTDTDLSDGATHGKIERPCSTCCRPECAPVRVPSAGTSKSAGFW